ncbi:MAG: hypothetical protein COB59_11465 [Rhodospirillaceae bacterium]|nr:MAG: hypothetical protein COB59_11465 [Rhodospirillaceae bacterium]
MKKYLILSIVLFAGACAAPQEPLQTTQDPAEKKSVDKAVRSFFKAPKAPKPALTSQQVLGKDEAWLRGKLGAPNFTRNDLQASIWMYKNKDCILNLFLYSEITPNAPLSVMHFDARDIHGHNMDRDACLATF